MPTFHAITRIVSGGQAGADRAGLDWAIENDVSHGGYCPKGRLAEDGPIPERYQLTELRSKSYPEPTKRNAAEADGTIIFSMRARFTGGSKLTAEVAEAAGKPCIHVWAAAPLALTVEAVRAFIADHRIATLNVAGSRGSKEPDVGEFVYEVLTRAVGKSMHG